MFWKRYDRATAEQIVDSGNQQYDETGIFQDESWVSALELYGGFTRLTS